MIKKLLLPLFLLLSIVNSNAQQSYSVDLISPELKHNASVVIRMEDHVFDVKNISQATYTYRTAITILNKNGERASSFYEFYNRFSSISDLKATMYDAKGLKVKEYKSAAFQDKSAISDGSIYEDGRLKQLDFLNTNFPYTIAYSFTVEYTGLPSYRSWYPVDYFGTAVETSTYTLRIPTDMTFKYMTSKGLKTDSSSVKEKKEYRWSCNNLPAVEHEYMSTGLRNIRPWVRLAPNNFGYDRTVGSLENWKTLGSWLNELNSEPQVLPVTTKTKVTEILKNAASPKEKIDRLYKYLQANTRYVSVQLGIGGYKPINADKVAAVNYGDCKALSNYMKALLAEANIASHLVMIGADMPSLIPEFASLNQANHMILCVPLKTDTVWLECTSQQLPMNYLTYDCSDKNVLLVTASGGKLVKTPAYKPQDNFQRRKINILLNDKGAADIDIESDYGYAQYENMYGIILQEPGDQRKYLMKNLGIPNMDLLNFSFLQTDKNKPVLREKLVLKSSQLLTSGADKTFLTLNLLNRRESVPEKIEERKTEFAVPFGYHDADEIIYTLPAGYKVEFLPQEVNITSEFGQYSMKAVQKDNTIIYKRSQTMNSKHYPPEKYNDLINFYKKVYQADKSKGILAKVI